MSTLVDVVFTPETLDEAPRGEHLFVIVDVLRASSTIVTALANGTVAIEPVLEPHEARALKAADASLILVGERNGLRLEGFDYGNSPRDLTPERVRGRTLVLCSTNGTRSVHAARAGAKAIVGCFLNISAAARQVAAWAGPTTVLCSGKSGAFSLEDVACAGMLIERSGSEPAGDRARVAVATYHYHAGDLRAALRQSKHGRYLRSLGMEEDVLYCARVDVTPIVPTLIAQGRLVARAVSGR